MWAPHHSPWGTSASHAYAHASVCCGSCGSDDLVTDMEQGDTVCRSCGVVAEGRIFDEKPRFIDQHFASDNRAPEGIEGGHGGNRVTYGDGSKIGMGRGAEQQIKKSTKRLKERLDKVSDISVKLRLVSELVSHAQALIHRISKIDSLNRRKRDPVCAAVVYMACRDHKVPRTLDEVTEQVHGLLKRDVGRTFLLITKEFQAQSAKAARPRPGPGRGPGAAGAAMQGGVVASSPAAASDEGSLGASSSSVGEDEEEVKEQGYRSAEAETGHEGGGGAAGDAEAAAAEAAARIRQAALERELVEAGRILPQQLIPRYCNELKLPRELQDAAMAIAGNTTALEIIPGRKPQVVSALSLHMAHYFFPNADLSRADIAKHTGVSEMQLKRGHKLMYGSWEKLLPDNIKQSCDAEHIVEVLHP